MDGPWWERSPHYLCSNTNKRNLTLDLGDRRRARAAARPDRARATRCSRTSRRACSATSGSSGSRSSELNPRCLLVRMPAFGLSGPWRDNVGFAQTMEQVTGLAWITGHRDDQPRIQQGPSDPNAGMHAAFALIVGLAERDATGRGSPARGHDGRGRAQRGRRAGDRGDRVRQPARARRQPQPARRAAGPLPRRGDETWLAVSVATDDAVAGPGRRARRRRRGRPTPSSRPYAGAARPPRRARRAPRGVERATRTPTPRPSCSSRTACPRRSAATRARCTTTRSCGRAASTRTSTTRWSACCATPTLPFRFASVDRWLRTPAPTLGQHNHEILVGDLGVDEARYAAARGRRRHRHPPEGPLTFTPDSALHGAHSGLLQRQRGCRRGRVRRRRPSP